MKSVGGDQCCLSHSLAALYISSNKHHRGHHLSPISYAGLPDTSRQQSFSPSISATVTSITSLTRKEEEEEEEAARERS